MINLSIPKPPQGLFGWESFPWLDPGPCELYSKARAFFILKTHKIPKLEVGGRPGFHQGGWLTDFISLGLGDYNRLLQRDRIYWMCASIEKGIDVRNWLT